MRIMMVQNALLIALFLEQGSADRVQWLLSSKKAEERNKADTPGAVNAGKFDSMKPI
jgi:hypothetical protein